jgi:polysaccharide deacetylase 2 family uncharacterized protein YibQ
MRATKKKRNKRKHSSLPLFAWFIAIALLTVVILEYIDFKKGGNSFIFTKVIKLKGKYDNIRRFNQKLLAILGKNKIPYDYFRDEEDKYHFKLDIDQRRYDSLISRLKSITTGLKGKMELAEIQGLSNKSIMLYNITLDQKVSHLLLVSKLKPQNETGKKPVYKTPDETKQPLPKITSSSPRIAFIIDDVGAYDIGPLELKRLNIPVTASILPDSRHAREAAHWAKNYQLETMIHLPMEPKNGNGNYNRMQTITMQSSDDQIRNLIRRARQAVPQARGLNNHQGSRATSNRQLMTRVMRVIKEEGLFFVDSRTIGNTVAYDVAKQMNIRTTHKDVFIDHIQTYSHSIAQIRKLVEIARTKGKAIAIGHPFDSTLRAIRDSKKYIRSKGIKIVYVKDLLE